MFPLEGLLMAGVIFSGDGMIL